MQKHLLLYISLCFVSMINGQQFKTTENKVISILKIDPKLMPIEKTAMRIIEVWDSLNKDETNNSVFTTLSIKTWESLFKTHYNNITALKNDTILLKLKYPLALIYFESGNTLKSYDLLSELYTRKNILNKQQIKKILTKLEEIYRDRGEMANALKIRAERIKYGFKGSYWVIYRDCGLYEEAIEDYKIAESKNITSDLNYAKHEYLLGELFFQNNQFDSALKYYQSGLYITNKTIINNKKRESKQILAFWKGCFTGLIAKIKMQTGDTKGAIPMLLYDISFSEIDKVNKLNKMILLSHCYLLINDFQNAKKYLDAINYEFSDLNINRNKTKIPLIKYKAEYFNKTKQYDSAFYFLQAYSSLMEEKNKNIRKNQAVLLLTKLDISKKREELKSKMLALKILEEENKNKNIKILKLILILSLSTIVAVSLSYIIYLNHKNKKKLTFKNTLLEENIKINNEHISHNDLLLKELHHRVKNNLQLMYSLLNLQKRRNDNQEIKDNLATVQNRIQTMALVHENLYNSGNFESVEVHKYIETLAKHLKTIYKQENENILQNIYVDTTIQIPIEQIISLGLIINEIISNAYKYAFNGNKGSAIEIILTQHHKLIILEISDDGPGFSKSEIPENSLGLKLIEIMCAQLKATLNTSTTNGVSYTIEFEI